MCSRLDFCGSHDSNTPLPTLHANHAADCVIAVHEACAQESRANSVGVNSTQPAKKPRPTQSDFQIVQRRSDLLATISIVGRGWLAINRRPSGRTSLWIRLASPGATVCDFCQRACLQTVEFKPPGIAIDNQQLARPEPAVEIELLAGLIERADNLDNKIGRPRPEMHRGTPPASRSETPPGRARGNRAANQPDRRPRLMPVRTVPRSCIVDDRPAERRVKPRRHLLMFIIRSRRHDVYPLPHFIETIEPPGMAFRQQPLRLLGIENESIHDIARRSTIN